MLSQAGWSGSSQSAITPMWTFTHKDFDTIGYADSTLATVGPQIAYWSQGGSQNPARFLSLSLECPRLLSSRLD